MLQLKRIWSRGYQQVSAEEDLEGKTFSQPVGYGGDEEREPLFEDEPGAQRQTHLPIAPRKRNTRRALCGLFSKVVLGFLVAVGIWSLIELVLLPVVEDSASFDAKFGASLQCQSGTRFWQNRAETVARVKPGPRGEHVFDARGDSVGTVTITSASEGSTDVQYTFSIRGEEQEVLDRVLVEYPSEDDSSYEMSRLSISTPKSLSVTSCTRFDVIIAVPPGLKKLHVASHVATHVRFDPDSTITLEEFYVTLYAMDVRNLIVPHERFETTKKLALEVYRGKIEGELSIGDHTSIKTQRGDGTVDVKVFPSAPVNSRTPEPAFFQTTTGYGTTKVAYIDDETSAHRPIRAKHLSSRKGSLNLSYEDAAFNGRIELVAGTNKLTGDDVHALPAGSIKESEREWTHYVGSEGGVDEIHVNSRGRVNLGF